MTQKTQGRPAKVLLVEDNPADQKLTLRALKKGKVQTKLYIVQDGEEAIDFLYNRGIFADKDENPRPDLILLDINLPKIDGKEVLKEIRSNDDLKAIPVIMLTTSSAERDVIDSYKLGVNAYISKPVKADEFYNVVNKLEEFWFRLTILPPNK